MSTYKNLISLGAAAVLALGLAACGGGSGGPPPGTALSYSGLQTGTLTELAADTYHVTGATAAFNDAVSSIVNPADGFAPGATVQLGDLHAGCKGPANCTITDNDNGSFTTTGTIVVGGDGAAVLAAVTPTDPSPTRDQKIIQAYASAASLDDSVDAMEKLAAASTEKGSARKAAMEAADKIGALDSDGDSLAAKNNAQAILDARQSLEDAVADATAKKTAAEMAKAGLPADADAAVVERLDDAIDDAKEAIEAAQDVLDAKKTVAGSLASYVAEVEGAKGDGTPASIGTGVAMAVRTALTTSGGVAAHSSTGPTTTIPKENKFSTPDGHSGMTWEEIVGVNAVKSMRVGAANVVTKVASVAGEATTIITDSGFDASNPSTFPTATGLTGSYLGIGGRVYCLAATTDCTVEAGKLAGSGWYFAPTTPTAVWSKAADAAAYTQMTYATYGHWLSGGNAGLIVNTYSRVIGPNAATTGSWIHHESADPQATDLLKARGDYSGMAAGRSVHTTLDGDGNITDAQSGRFTADVTLRAAFNGTESNLQGTVSNFVGTDNPDAVDPSWMVTLESEGIGTGSFTTGVTSDGTGRTTTGDSGTWSATSYGLGGATDGGDDGDATTAPNVNRPTGIHGGFTANFSDGHVAGAYATRKQ